MNKRFRQKKEVLDDSSFIRILFSKKAYSRIFKRIGAKGESNIIKAFKRR